MFGKVLNILFQSRIDHDRSALSFTPSLADLSGMWTVHFVINDQPVLCFAQLEQVGASITGELQFKFAALPPVQIRGLLHGLRFLAIHWRPCNNAYESGIIDLELTPDKNELIGNVSSYDAGDTAGQIFDHQWVRISDTASN